MNTASIAGSTVSMVPACIGYGQDCQIAEDDVIQPPEGTPAPEEVSDESASSKVKTNTHKGATNRGKGAHGVLRLLEAGHFRGVADVRLRINHYEQIKAAEVEKIKSAANEAVANLAETISVGLGELASSEGLSDEQGSAIAELGETFDTAVQELAESFRAAEGAEGKALTAGLEEAFDALTAELGAVISPSKPDDPSSEELDAGQAGEDAAVQENPVEPDTEVVNHLDSLMQSLQQSFVESMAELNEALVSTSLLPEPSAKHGRGGAYEKFLAMYEQLRGASTISETEMTDSVELEA